MKKLEEMERLRREAEEAAEVARLEQEKQAGMYSFGHVLGKFPLWILLHFEIPDCFDTILNLSSSSSSSS